MGHIQMTEQAFSGRQFERLNFAGIELRDKCFDDCTFVGCNFSDGALLGCRFDACSFSGCNLSTVAIRGSTFREVIFRSSKLVGIDWTSARWPSVALTGQVEFDECLLNGCSFFGLYLQELKMEACQAHEVDFSEADCGHASFIQTDFAGATFHHTNLAKADFSDATNYAIDVGANNVEGAKFSLPDAVNLLRGLGIELID